MNIFFALIIPTFAGFLLTSLLLKKEDSGIVEKLALGYGLGLGMLSMQIFFMGLLAIGFRFLPMLAGQLIIIALLIYLNLRYGRMSCVSVISSTSFAPGSCACSFSLPGGSKAAKLVAGLALIWIILKCLFVLYEDFTRPLFAVDTWSNWAAGAKFFYYEGSMLLDPESEHYFGRDYRLFMGHPLHTVFLQLWQALWLGSFHEVLVKSWSAFYFIAFLIVFYFTVKRESGSFRALLWTLFVSTAPLLVYHGTEGLADLPLTYYSFLSVAFMWRYIKTERGGLLIVSGVFAGMAVFTKNEGLLVFTTLLFTLVVFTLVRGRAKSEKAYAFVRFILPFVIVAGPWLLFKFLGDFGFGHSGAGSEMAWLSDPTYAEGTRTGLHIEVIPIGLWEIFVDKANFNLTIPFWLVLSVIGLREWISSEIKYLYLIIIMIVGAFFFIYLTLEVTAVTEATGIHRNALLYLPIIAFASAMVLEKLLSNVGDKSS